MMTLNGVEIEDTFAEAFPMTAVRAVVTAETPEWARTAGQTATGYAASVIGCDAEAGIERELSPSETPDGRPGVDGGVTEGFVLVSAMHISASVFVNDHESGLWHDILHWLEHTVAPWAPERYRHNETGEDNAAAHLRSLTIGHEVIVPITAGKLDVGPWQRVFYGEWDGQRRKRVIIKVLGE